MPSQIPSENSSSKENNSHIGSSSPRKKRTNSTPTRKNAAEKKQILQQLVSPNTNNQVRFSNQHHTLSSREIVGTPEEWSLN